MAPTEKPINRLTIRLMTALVEPTAARAVGPMNWPTTTMSAALNSSCKMPDSARGMANRTILPSRGPFVMSISKPALRFPMRSIRFKVYTSTPSNLRNACMEALMDWISSSWVASCSRRM